MLRASFARGKGGFLFGWVSSVIRCRCTSKYPSPPRSCSTYSSARCVAESLSLAIGILGTVAPSSLTSSCLYQQNASMHVGRHNRAVHDHRQSARQEPSSAVDTVSLAVQQSMADSVLRGAESCLYPFRGAAHLDRVLQVNPLKYRTLAARLSLIAPPAVG